MGMAACKRLSHGKQAVQQQAVNVSSSYDDCRAFGRGSLLSVPAQIATKGLSHAERVLRQEAMNTTLKCDDHKAVLEGLMGSQTGPSGSGANPPQVVCLVLYQQLLSFGYKDHLEQLLGTTGSRRSV